MRPEKHSMVEELRGRVAGSSFVLLADFRGLTVGQMSALRGQMREVGAELHVVKNRLLRRVAGERAWRALEERLRGPSALVTGRDVLLAAKALRKFASENSDMPSLKGGMLGDRFMSDTEIEALTKLPSREVLLGMFVGAVAAPLTRLVGAMRQKILTLLYVLKAVEEKKRAGGA